jgi:hypothetical protein
MIQGQLFDGGLVAACFSCIGATATMMPAYMTASGCYQEPWICHECGMAGYVSTRASSVTDAQRASVGR